MAKTDSYCDKKYPVQNIDGHIIISEVSMGQMIMKMAELSMEVDTLKFHRKENRRELEDLRKKYRILYDSTTNKIE